MHGKEIKSEISELIKVMCKNEYENKLKQSWEWVRGKVFGEVEEDWGRF